MKLLFMFSILISTSFLYAQEANEIQSMIQNERYATAQKILKEKALEEDNPEWNLLLVQTYLHQDMTEEAKMFLEQKKININSSLSADPFNKIAFASYLLNTGDQAKAAEIFSEIMNDKKLRKNSALLMAIANAYINVEKGDANDALNVLAIIEKKEKDNAGFHLLKGKAYSKLHDGTNAYVAYQSAIKINPGLAEAHYRLGNIFKSQRNEEMYMEEYQKAYAIDSTYAPVLEALYNHYYFKNVKTARVYLERFIRYTDYSIKNDYDLADIYYLNKDYTKAIEKAGSVIDKEKEQVKPRLYKLIAYSYFELGENEKAYDNLGKYFTKEDTKKFIAKDYEFKAKLLMAKPGFEKEAIASYEKAFELDTLLEGKTSYAVKIAEEYAKIKDYSSQATWLGKIYEVKQNRTNVDLFNWGLAHYKAGELQNADTVFGKYISLYPDNIYGYYWRAQVNAAIDTSMELGLAIPIYKKLVALAEADKNANKAMLLKAYGYFGGYEANITKDFVASLNWFEKMLEIDPNNEMAENYAGIMRKWIDKANKKSENAENEETEEVENK